ncbi:MAG: MBL fold metallo-hydrolase [Planctomycetales bacterium]|nr:MBL fold metallo-hydrolase [Planctomycetales bacterium]
MTDHLGDLYVLDVGQGDSIVLHLETGQTIVVDCHSPNGETPRAQQLLERLEAEGRGTRDIDLLCLTHPDWEHYSGMDRLLEWVCRERPGAPAGRVWQVVLYPQDHYKALFQLSADWEAMLRQLLNPRDHTTRQRLADFIDGRDQFAILFKRLGEYGARRVTGFQLLGQIGEAKVFSLGPTEKIVGAHAENVYKALVEDFADQCENEAANAISRVLWIHLGETRILLTGDATAEALEDAVNAYVESGEKAGPLRSDIVMASHHGACEHSTPELWEKVLKPNGIVVFSAGGSLSTRFPHRQTIGHVQSGCASPQFACTSICETLLTQSAHQPASLPLVNSLNDDTLDAASLSEHSAVPWRQRSYHGTVKFEIFRANPPKFLPQRNPCLEAGSCPHHA